VAFKAERGDVHTVVINGRVVPETTVLDNPYTYTEWDAGWAQWKGGIAGDDTASPATATLTLPSPACGPAICHRRHGRDHRASPPEAPGLPHTHGLRFRHTRGLRRTRGLVRSPGPHLRHTRGLRRRPRP